jgi:ribosomal protein S18 acetylase RimI-like enzyme
MDRVIRTLNPDTDFPALVTLLNSGAKADSGTPTTEAEQGAFREGSEKYGHFQQWVIEHSKPSNNLIAYAALFKQPATPYAESLLVVHPEFRQQGLEEQLLNLIIAEAKAQKSEYLYDLVEVNNKERQAFVLDQGFKPERGFRFMTMILSKPLPKVGIHAQFSLRTYAEVKDMKVMIEIVNKGWSDLPGHKVADGENVDWVNQQPHDGIFLLFDKNKIIGCVSGVVTEDGRGQVDAPALIPEHRQPEKYLALLLVGLEYLQKQGCNEVTMTSWGDYDSTIAAYTELGFTTTVHELGYKLNLTQQGI